MPFELKYGDSGVLEIDLPADSILGDFSSPRGTPLDDPAAAVAAAVSDPLEFPRLQEATIPGDRVVLAVDRGVPQMPAVVAGVIHTLLEGGADPTDIEIALAAGEPLRKTASQSISIVKSARPMSLSPSAHCVWTSR
jgi:hypothetical protein